MVALGLTMRDLMPATAGGKARAAAKPRLASKPPESSQRPAVRSLSWNIATAHDHGRRAGRITTPRVIRWGWWFDGTIPAAGKTFAR